MAPSCCVVGAHHKKSESFSIRLSLSCRVRLSAPGTHPAQLGHADLPVPAPTSARDLLNLGSTRGGVLWPFAATSRATTPPLHCAARSLPTPCGCLTPAPFVVFSISPALCVCLWYIRPNKIVAVIAHEPTARCLARSPAMSPSLILSLSSATLPLSAQPFLLLLLLLPGPPMRCRSLGQ